MKISMGFRELGETMNWIIAKIKWIMIVSGALTCTLLYAAIAPQAALLSMFGATLEGSLAEIVVRNWGGLIALVGAMQIYGAFELQSRSLILTIASISKLLFVGLILMYGRQYLDKAGIAIAIDLVLVVLFIGYFVGIWRKQRST
jgi:hypothetical protein